MPPKASTSKSGKTDTATTGAAAKPKSILIFCDGTSNDGNKAARIEQTNVFRLFQCVDDKAPDGTPQLAFYQQGLGTTPEVGKGEVKKGLVPGLLGVFKGMTAGIGELKLRYWVIMEKKTDKWW
jgi:hypothetical protein